MRSATAFFLKLVILALPLSAALASYVYYDPFMVLRVYDDYNADHGVDLNRDFVSTQVYLNQAHTYNYDSFIFGSSRSMAYLTTDWSPWIGSKAAFHFDSWFETLYGVDGKFRLLDRNSARIQNALLVVDSNLLAGTEDREGLIHMKHPAASGRSYAFHAMCLKTYLGYKFLFPYIASRTMGTPFLDASAKSKLASTRVENDMYRIGLDARIAENEEKYYAEMAEVFGDPKARVETTGEPVIGDKSLAMLREIRAICQKHHTDIRIVISPLYDQVKLNPADVAILTDLFGADHVNDFSGANPYTAEVHNYYEGSHYRPRLGRELLRVIYSRVPSEKGLERGK